MPLGKEGKTCEKEQKYRKNTITGHIYISEKN